MIVRNILSLLLVINSLVGHGRYLTKGSDIPASELDSLHDLYLSTHGQNWDWGQQQGVPWNFTANANPCLDFWEGVVCTTQPADDGFLHVDALQLSSYGLLGSLPESIGNLTQLVLLNLTRNFLSGGPVPDTIGNLHLLQDLELHDCYLAGTVPSTFANLSTLTIVNLEQNIFTGTLFPFCALTQLQQLVVAFNFFDGPLPSCLGNLTSLLLFDINYNSFTGTLPASLGNLRQVSYFNVGLNSLNGSIPDSYRGLTSIVTFLLSANLLTGMFPDFIATLVTLEHIEVNQNLFTGSLPERIGDLTALTQLAFHYNLLNGTIPASLTDLHLLELLNMENNLLTGTIPAGFENLQQLTAVNMRINQLSGTLPAELLALESMVELFLSENRFTGTISDVVSPTAELATIVAGRNSFSGTLPYTIVNAKNMVVLDFAENAFTGTIPSLTADSGYALFYLNTAYNYMTGPIPELSVSGGPLAYINMSTNHLSGTLPESIGELYALDFLYLYSNLLTGTIPDVWGNLHGLNFLTMDSNLLTGKIPGSIGETSLLQSLNLSYNHLTGTIPATLSQLEYLSVLLLMDNALTGGINYVINPALQKNITTLQVSNNQLTGTLPGYLNLLPALKVFAAVSNCFTGSIPLSLCESRSLDTLALDGLQAATSCQQRLFPAALEGTIVAESLYAIRSPFVGGVPACLFKIRNLTTLHLSGNELEGPLPSDLELAASLVDLSLSHNKLTGTIPAALLQRNWRNLDLSYNVFVGSLEAHSLPAYLPSTSFSLDNNRLSGKLPGALAGLVNVNVLESNLFSCKLDRSDLPQNDPNQGKYDCASTTFDDSLYTWLAILSVVLCALVSLRCSGQGSSSLRERALELVRTWAAASGADTPSYVALVESSKRIVHLSVVAAEYIVLVLLPIYAVCTALYGTYTHQYAYAISAAYLSGPVPFAWEFVFLMLLIAVLILLVAALTREVANVPPVESAPDLSRLDRRRSFAVYLFTALLNFVVVLGVNTAYVIIALNKNGLALTVTQIALALFKVAFNSMCSPALLRWTSQRFAGRQPSPASFVTVQLLVSIVNNILVPSLVVSIISPDCFYNIFKSAAKVNTYFTYDGKCATYSPYGGFQFQCTQEEVAVAQTSYSPPFDYSYQCSSSFITYYAPAYVIMCIIAGFALPVAQVVLQRLHSRAVVGTRWFAVLDTVLPRILKPLPSEANVGAGLVNSTRNIFVPIFDASQHMITLLTYLALLMTYGAVFPPLAICFAVCIVAMVAYTRIKVGRFLLIAREANQPGQVAIVEQECAGVGEPGILVRAVSMIAVSAGVFYTLFLFDTLGDRWGLQYAYWVLFVTPMWAPLCVLLMRWCVSDVSADEPARSTGHSRRTEFELSELSAGTISPLMLC